jgi:putative SOS response-associated peptidase YedK
MLQPLLKYLTEKGYKLTPKGDCYIITSPTGKQTIANLRWKTRPVWGRKTKRWEWSVPLRHWQCYIANHVETFFVLEKSTGTIFVARLQDLQAEAREYHGEDLDAGGTVFLPCDRYKRLAQISVE